MSFNDELQKLRKVKKQCLVEIQSVEDEKHAELEQIEETKKQVVLKYAELSKSKYQELREHNRRIDIYCRLIEFHSYFDAKEIGSAIASLMRTFEGTNYIYQEAEYHTTEVEVLAFDKQKTKVTKHPRIVIAEDSRRNWYSDYKGENLNSIVRNGKAIILSDDTLEREIPFYYANTGTHTLEQRVKFGGFSYVKDFIDKLISYKIEYSLKNLSSDEIERLKIDFISSRVEQIEENYRLVAQQQEKQMKQKLDVDKENRQLILKRVLDKKKK